MADDEYEGGPDQLAEKMELIDEELADQRAETLRAGLADYELDDEDAALLAGITMGEDGIMFSPALPVVAIVGRPNVGKSALVNRILGRREAVVEDTPGVTRDRVTYKAEWADRRFSIVDTGGWEPDARGIDRSVAMQAEIAIDLADMVLFVVDAMVGATSTDEHVVKLLRKSGKPVFLVANKIDDTRQEPEAAALWALGLGEPYPVSAIHGRGVADLLDAVLKKLPEISAVAKQEIGGPRRVAILGRPNVGKSSLLNKAAGEERVVVNELMRHDARPGRRGRRARRQDVAPGRHGRHPSSRAHGAGRGLLRVAAHLGRSREGGGRGRRARCVGDDQRAGRAHHRPRAGVRPCAGARVQQVGSPE